MSPRSSLRRVLFAAAALAAIAFAAVALTGQIRELRDTGGLSKLRIGWSALGASTTLVLVAYLVLIETWRRVVRVWDAELAFADAARIWCVSNLGRYLPGKVWQIAAMGVMAQERGVSAVAATGSAVVINLVNLVVGFAVVAATGAEFFGDARAAYPLFGLSVAGVLALPYLVPRLFRLVRRLTGKDISIRDLPSSSLWIAAVGCSVAWVIYGFAFRLFVIGVLGVAPGAAASYIAAFTGSYLLGYIAIFAPGGIGVRELSLVSALRRLQLGVAGGAGLIALASRVWLTATEVLPGILFLAYDAWRGRPRPNA